MADQAYHVVFRGQVLPDRPIEAVKGNLAKLFKADEARIAALFSGRPVIVKRGLSREEAERYRALFAKAGAVCDIIPSAGAPPPPPPAPDSGGEEGTGTQAASPATAADRRRASRPAASSSAPAADRLQALGGLRRKMGDIDPEATGEKLAALVKDASAAVRSGAAQKRLAGLEGKKLLWGGVAGIGLIVVIVLFLGGGSKPMPIEKDMAQKFAKQYYREIRQTDLAAAGTKVLVERAREVVEDMGYDFDRTLVYWLSHKDRVESQGALDVYRTILVEPVSVAVSAGLSGIDTQIAPETKRVFETAAAVPPGVDLDAIRMIRECPSDGRLLEHDALLQVLKDNGIPIDAAQPDLTIADVFFGLERAGFIKIHRRWEKDVQFSDIEVLAPDAMRRVEEQLAYLAQIKAQAAPP